MIKIVSSAVLLPVFFLCQAHADDKVNDGFLKYQVDERCHVLAYMGALTDNQTIIRMRNLKTNECIDNEQAAYSVAKSKWNSLTQEHRQYCLRVANNAPFKNYYLLASCVANFYEMEDGHQTPRTFHP